MARYKGLLEIMNIPYTGSMMCASAVCMDKGLTRVVLQAAGIPVPAGEIHCRLQGFPLVRQVIWGGLLWSSHVRRGQVSAYPL